MNGWLHKGLEKILSQPHLIDKRVADAKLIYGGDEDRICEYLIRKKCEINTAVGGATGAAGIIPVIGTLSAVVTTVTVELVTVTQQEIELCLEIDRLYGNDIGSDEIIYEILAIISHKRKVENPEALNRIAVSKTVDSMAHRYARVGLLKALKKTARILELRVGARAFTKLVPVLGIFGGGGINYYLTKTTGLLAQDYFKRKHEN